MEEKKRTTQELVIEAFRLMIKTGEAKLFTNTIYLRTGGTMTKTIYKVEPRRGNP